LFYVVLSVSLTSRCWQAVCRGDDASTP